jgi:quercetin dioxygenase-like cupin family protein
MTHRSLVSYGSVAIVAAALSSIATWSAMNFSGSAQAQTPAAATIPLLTQPLADLPGREVRITLLDRGPGNSSPPHHHHPGHHTFGYVVEGTYEFGVNGQPPRTLKAGDTFYEPPGAIHSVSRNPSPDKPLKIVVFMVADQKNPSTVNETRP